MIDPYFISVIIAARNEEDYIADCLNALLTQDAAAFEVIVAANACTDQTVGKAQEKQAAFVDRGCKLIVLDLADGGKTYALNAADNIARSDVRIYLDADVICASNLLGQIWDALSVEKPRYATGTLVVAPAKTWVTRAYARVWTQLPFVKGGAVGAGFFAVNGPGRARWADFPNIISDDTFVRMQFSLDERVEVPATYIWPMVEGFKNLVKVRKRQDAGVTEIHDLYPDIIENEGKVALGLAGMMKIFLRRPISFLVYLMVHIAVRFGRKTASWTRGR